MILRRTDFFMIGGLMAQVTMILSSMKLKNTLSNSEISLTFAKFTKDSKIEIMSLFIHQMNTILLDS